MAELTEDEGNSRLLAALCYLPFLLINMIAISYVLLTRKGGSFARFHAIQGAMFFLAGVALQLLLGVAYLGLLANAWMSVLTGGSEVRAIPSQMTLAIVLMVAIAIFDLLFVLSTLVLAFQAYKGKRTKLPLIGARAEKMA